MLRSILAAGLVLVLTANVSEAAKPKKGHTAHGTVKKVDPSAGTLTIAVKKKKETPEKDFTVSDGTKVIVYTGKDKKELTGKDALKDEQIKEGAKVAVVTDADGKVTAVRIGTPPKGKAASGTVKKVDTAKGTITVATKVTKAVVDKDFTLTDATKVVLFGADGKKKQLTGKDGLKDDLVKEGVKVKVATDPDGNVKQVVIGTPVKKAKKQ